MSDLKGNKTESLSVPFFFTFFIIMKHVDYIGSVTALVVGLTVTSTEVCQPKSHTSK